MSTISTLSWKTALWFTSGFKICCWPPHYTKHATFWVFWKERREKREEGSDASVWHFSLLRVVNMVSSLLDFFCDLDFLLHGMALLLCIGLLVVSFPIYTPGKKKIMTLFSQAKPLHLFLKFFNYPTMLLLLLSLGSNTWQYLRQESKCVTAFSLLYDWNRKRNWNSSTLSVHIVSCVFI